MKTKALMIGAIFVATVLLAGTVSWAGGRIAHRQMKQFHRITDGLRKGTIIDKEFVRLNREQWRIQQTIRRAWADGRLNPRERRHIHKLQRKAGEHIYRAKHNGVVHYNRKPSYGPLRPRHRPPRHGYHFRHRNRPTYYGYHFRGRFSRPHSSFSLSMGWR